MVDSLNNGWFLDNPEKADNMAKYGRKTTINDIDGAKIAKRFHEFCLKVIIYNFK